MGTGTATATTTATTTATATATIVEDQTTISVTASSAVLVDGAGAVEISLNPNCGEKNSSSQMQGAAANSSVSTHTRHLNTGSAAITTTTTTATAITTAVVEAATVATSSALTVPAIAKVSRSGKVHSHHSKGQVVIIPATPASTVATNAAKKIRRAFSMPRNPFQWSRKFRTSEGCSPGENGNGKPSGCNGGGHNSALTACVGGGHSGLNGSIVSLNSYAAVGVSKDAKGAAAAADDDDMDVRGEMDETTTMRQRQDKKYSTNSGSGNRVFRRSSLRKFINRIAHHVSASVNIGANKHQSPQANSLSSADRVPPIGVYQWPADQTPGVTGLKNHGNTCFMNAVLQCLSHTDILAEYFVLDQYKADLKRRNKINSRKFGTKGELTEQLANVLKALWMCKNESDHSTSFKAVVDRYGSQFRSSTQHDAQEFLFWLLDKVHEDLNTATKRRYKSVKNNYGRSDEAIAAETLANHIRCNNSFVQAVFQAQFRSSLTCPRCKKQSNTFDPFHCISVQLPQLTQQTVFVTVVYLQQQQQQQRRRPRQIKLGLTIAAGSPIVALREQLQASTGIASERIVLVDINETGFTRVYYDTQPISTLAGIETIYCIEVPASDNVAPLENGGATTSATIAAAAGNDGSSNSAGNSNNGSVTSKVATTTKAATTATATATAATTTTDLLLLVANVKKSSKSSPTMENDVGGGVDGESETCTIERFGAPFCIRTPRDCTYMELQKKLLRELSAVLKPDVLSRTTPLNEMFQIRLQDPSADPDTYLDYVEHPLLTEMIDMALSVLSAEAGPAHVKLLLEWAEPEAHFIDDVATIDAVVDDESVAQLRANKSDDTALTLEQCLEHYTKAETLSAEDAWRCPHCQQYLPVVKTLGLWSLPDILVVHFKRFRQHQAKGPNAAKLTTMVKFPLNAFDMSPHLAKGTRDTVTRGESASLPRYQEAALNCAAAYYGRPSPWKRPRTGDSRSSTLNRENKETCYDLYAVCYHQGDTLETGHYTAACKNPYDHQWYKFDDQRVTKVISGSIEEEIINNEAYMLFYQKRKTDIMAECSGSSSTSGEHWVSKIAPPLSCDKQQLGLDGSTAITTTTDVVTMIATTEADTDALLEQRSFVNDPSSPAPPTQISINCTEKSATAAEVITAEVTNSNDDVIINLSKDTNNRTEMAQLEYADHDDDDDVDDGDDKDDGDSDHNAGVGAAAATAIAIEGSDDINELDILEALTPIDGSATEEQIKQIFVINGENVPKDNKKIDDEEKSNDTNAGVIKVSTATFDVNNETEEKNITTATIAATATATADQLPPPLAQYSQSPNATSNSSASSSISSLSSHSSPRSLIHSTHASSALQSKFNGFSASYLSANTNNNNNSNQYKETLLSSSLKSNSSSSSSSGFITATAVVHSNDFVLNGRSQQQQQQQQKQQWHGSRSSVSAVENASSSSLSSSTQQVQHHMQCLNLRHSFSTSSNYKLKECNDTLSSMLRNSANTCSKDTLIFIDQQSHHHHHSLIEDDDDAFMDGRSLWISPVTPHKLITVSPKN